MIRLVVALYCEAKPLIAHYGLKPAGYAQGFRVFQNQEIALIVSGTRRTAAAAATAYLQALLGGGRNRAWLNIGSGGHRRHGVGKLFLAHKITDAATGHCWYPPLIITPPCATAAVQTVDRPMDDFPQDAIYEMEAAGFYATACRFASAELVQAVKVISDNPALAAQQMTPKTVERLIEGQLAAISAIIEQTAALAWELMALDADPPHYQEILERWHFSVAQRHRLRQLLQRYQVLYPKGEMVWPNVANKIARGKDVLCWLEGRIAACPVRI